DQLLAPYRARHPGLEVAERHVALPAAEYRRLLLVAAAREALPDVFQLDDIGVPAVVDRGHALDLAPSLGRVGVDLTRFDPTVLAMFRRGAGIYALPRGFTPLVVVYNRDLLDRAGIAAPTGDWTWDDFGLAARRLTGGGGRGSPAPGIRFDSAPGGGRARHGLVRLRIRRAGEPSAPEGGGRARRRPHRLGRRCDPGGSGHRAAGGDRRGRGAGGRRHPGVGGSVSAGRGARARDLGRARGAMGRGRGRTHRPDGSRHRGRRRSCSNRARYRARARPLARRYPMTPVARWRGGALVALAVGLP